ncbi:hypothetical protein, partial [Klebsiella pneumoniae]|uniref:hypothetical protein n=1 Tax=Klebsiella pneumoniae TaxID=573 RepID=UPI001601241D
SWRAAVAPAAVVAAAAAVASCGVALRRAAALAAPFSRARLAFAAPPFLLPARPLHRGVARGGARLLLAAAPPLFGVAHVVPRINKKKKIHHQV